MRGKELKKEEDKKEEDKKEEDKKEEKIKKNSLIDTKKICLTIGCAFGYVCIAIGVIMAILILTTYKF